MNKTAILTQGTEKQGYETREQFDERNEKNIEIVTEVLVKEKYPIKNIPINDVAEYLKKESPNSELFFYLTGHGGDEVIGSSNVYLQDIFDSMKHIKEHKMIVLDSCMGHYKKGEEFKRFSLPKNSIIIGAEEVGESSNLARILWDLRIARKIPLNQITDNSFKEIKQNWVYFVQN